MIKQASLAAAAVALAAAVPATGQAQTTETTSFYGSLGYSQTDLDGLKLGAITGRLGARFGPYLGVEGEGGFGVNDDRLAAATIGGMPFDVELKSTFAAYAVGYLPVSPNADLYARLGYGTTRIRGSVGGTGSLSMTDGDESWNYGVGGQYFFDGKNGVRADYTRHEFARGDDANTWSVGYVRKF